MKNDILISLRLLSDAELVAGLKSSLVRERHETANIVAHLAELDTRDVYLREGYSSLFVYCRDALGMSEGEAYNRIEVARAARRFPVVLAMLADGGVTLTAARLLAPHLTPANHRDVLGSARRQDEAGNPGTRGPALAAAGCARFGSARSDVSSRDLASGHRVCRDRSAALRSARLQAAGRHPSYRAWAGARGPD
jgi:hypothetical protein